MGPECGKAVFTLLTSWVFSTEICQVPCIRVTATQVASPQYSRVLWPLQHATMEEDTQWYSVSVSLGICLLAWIGFLWHHAKRLLSRPNITVLPLINKPVPPRAPTVTSLQPEESASLSFHHPIHRVSAPGGELGSLRKGSTKGIFRTGMGIMTNTSRQQAPVKMEIRGCYPRGICAFQFGWFRVKSWCDSVCSLFFPGPGCLAYWKVPQPFAGQHHRLQDSWILLF